MASGNGKIYEFGDFRLIPQEGLLLRDGEPIPLTLKAFATLVELVERSGHLVSKTELLEAVWEDSFVEEGAVSRSVHAIRGALGENPKSNTFIQTVPRRGYRFVAPVRIVAGHSGAFRLKDLDSADQLATDVVSGNGGYKRNGYGKDGAPGHIDTLAQAFVAPEEMPVSLKPAERSSSIRGNRFAFGRRPLIALTAGVLVGLLALGLYVYRLVPNPSPTVESLGVMPFSNLTGQENDAYIVDGITEHLINSLSRIPGLYVAAPASSFAARDRSLAPHEASKELKVGHLLSGSVQRDGEFLRVSMRLTEGTTGRVVWTRDAFRPAAEIFALQDDIARLSAEAITGNPALAAVLGNYGTADREAYLHYLKGRYLWHKQTGPDIIKAISEFESSVARDANFALAYCGLADSYVNLPFFIPRPPNETMPIAAEHAAKALTIDPNLPEALFSDASVKFWYRRDIPAAERSIQRAIKLQPNFSMAHDLHGALLITQDRVDEGLAKIKQAVELDPLAHYQACNLAWQYLNSGRYTDAAALSRANLDKIESCPFERLFLGQALSEMGRPEEGGEEVAKIEAYAPDWVPGIAERARIYAVIGKREDAAKLLSGLVAMGEIQYVDPYAIAVIHSGLRDADKTLYWLNKAVEANSHNLVYLNRDPRFNGIRSDTRFADILRRAGLPNSAAAPKPKADL